MKFLYNSQMVTILAGPDQEKFVVHQPLLCSKSQYFNKALTGSFEESKTGIVRLEDVSPVLFRIVVTWLYNGKIVYTTSDDNSNIDQDFAGLGYASIPPETPARVHKDTSTWSRHALVGLYLLADRLDIKMLRINTIDALRGAIARTKRGLDAKVYQLIDSNTAAKSPLRKFAVDHLVYGVKHGMADWSFWEQIPHDITTEALLTMGGRLPRALCDDCHKKGLLFNEIALATDHPCKHKDTKPYSDMCLYHEHADDEEKKACRARRSKTVVK
ncbi:hypothetical protein KCU78_g9828, partial [Aureobasidium melanogenum]